MATHRNTENNRWVSKPEGSTWGDFGSDDVLGRLNLLTPDKVREGFAEVRDYRTFSLSLPLTLPGGTVLNPNRLPPVHRPNLRNGLVNANCQVSQVHEGATDVLNDDLVVLHNQYSTQWDSLAHAGSMFDADGDGVPEPVYYNGYRAGTDVHSPERPEDCSVTDPSTSTADFGPLGIHSMAQHPIQGRAVLVDLEKHLGRDRKPVGFDDLQQIINEDQLDIRPGDIMVVHTGFATELMAMGGKPDSQKLESLGAGLDGRDQRLLQWITDVGIAAIAADNTAVELYPALPVEGPAAILPLHEHCLFKLGVPLGELWYTQDLAHALREAGRSAFLLTAPPLHLPGAAGSPLNPIATI